MFMKIVASFWAILGVLVGVGVSFDAFAVGAPLAVCVAKNGVVSAKAKCGGKEAKLTTSYLNRIMTPVAGPQGPAGVVDPSRCRTQMNSNSGYN